MLTFVLLDLVTHAIGACVTSESLEEQANRRIAALLGMIEPE